MTMLDGLPQKDLIIISESIRRLRFVLQRQMSGVLPEGIAQLVVRNRSSNKFCND
jgi:hypothetical protein